MKLGERGLSPEGPSGAIRAEFPILLLHPPKKSTKLKGRGRSSHIASGTRAVRRKPDPSNQPYWGQAKDTRFFDTTLRRFGDNQLLLLV